jgi:4-amino-4-deoxy-L-arabinose transferase-like glycosyltransferase
MPSASPKPIPKRSVATTLLLMALWIAFYGSFTLFRPALLDDADSVHAEVAREMLLRHDWVTLYANGIRYLEKAPLLYWSMAASFRVFGASTASARIPLALTVLALALSVEMFARRAFHSASAGLYAALILLSSFGIFLFTRITIPDAMVCLWLTLAMLCFWLTEETAAIGPSSEARVPHSSQLDRDGWDVNSPRLLCYGFAACCALNVLTKGLIGIVFPIGIVIAYLLLTRSLRGAIVRIRQLHPLSSTAVFLAIAAPWHILIALANPAQGHPGGLAFALHPAAGAGHWSVPLPSDGNVHGWLWFYFVNEQLLRYLNLRVPRDYDTVPLWLFWGLCLVWLMPWSAYLFHAIAHAVPLRTRAWRERLRGRRLGPEERTLLLLAIWAALPMLFFSLSTRQEYYVLPALPAAVLLVAAWLAKDSKVTVAFSQAPGPRVGGTLSQATIEHLDLRNPDPETVRGPFNVRVESGRTGAALVLLILGALFAAASLFFLLHPSKPSADTDLAALLQQNPSDYAMSMGHFLDLNAQALGLFRLPLAIASASLFLGPLVSYVLRKRAQPHAATLALAVGASGFLLAAHLGLQTFAPVLSSQQLAAAIAPQLQPDDLIVIHQEYEYASTLGFYLKRPRYTLRNDQPVAINPIHILTDPSYNGTAEYGRSSNLWYGSFFPDSPRIFETRETLAQKWASPQRIFLWQDLANQPSALTALLSPVYVIAKSGGKEIVSNQPDP